MRVRLGMLDDDVPHVVLVIGTDLVELVERPFRPAIVEFLDNRSTTSHHRLVIAGRGTEQSAIAAADVVS